MSENVQGNIWIDLTDLSEWSGHLTGIQRVVFEIASRYSEQANVQFFVFDDSSKTFRHASFEDIQRKIEAIKSSEGNETPLRSDSLKRRVKNTALSVYQSSPQWVRSRATPGRVRRVKSMYTRAYAAYSRYQHKRRDGKAAKSTPQVNFAAADTVLVLGKAWDYPSFGPTLRQVKVRTGCKVIQVVYDLIPVYLPHVFGQPLIAPYTQHMFEVAQISDGLLAISKSTKKDMQKFCSDLLIPCPPIEVVRLGDDLSQVESVKPQISELKKGQYLLSVGTVEVRKNHALLYMAYKEGLARGIKLPKLVIIGGKGWYTDDIMYQFRHDPQLKGLVVFPHNISDAELRWLYENCRFTVYPSVYEGWGLPIAESLAYGKLCLSSHAASMTEISGELIDYFSPYNSGECLEKITHYLNDDILSKKEIRISKEYKPTSWNLTFDQVTRFVSKTG